MWRRDDIDRKIAELAESKEVKLTLATDSFPSAVLRCKWLESLTILCRRSCNNLISLPDNLDKLSNLHSLEFENFTEIANPEALEKLHSLRKLKLPCKILPDELPPYLEHLCDLEISGIQWMPNWVEHLSKVLSQVWGYLAMIPSFEPTPCLN